MKAKVRSKSIKADELTNCDNATLIFGLAMTAVFIGMLILNVIS